MGRPYIYVFSWSSVVVYPLLHSGFIYRNNTLEIGAWLKSTCVLNVQNCACHLSDGIPRFFIGIGERKRVDKAYVQNIYRSLSYLMHEESNEPTITNHSTLLSLRMCVRVCVDGCPPVRPKYVLHRCKRLNYHLPITISYWKWKRVHAHTHTYQMRPLNKHK